MTPNDLKYAGGASDRVIPDGSGHPACDSRPSSGSEADVVARCQFLQNENNHDGVLAQLDSYVTSGTATAAMWHLHGISLYRLDRFAEAHQDYERALAIQPGDPIVLNSLGFVLQDMGRVEEARQAYEQAFQTAPEFSIARLNLGLVQLKLGDWQNGWENFEARWEGSAESKKGTFQRSPCPLPQWNGEADTGEKALLVIAEQGFGDCFQFSRFLLLATRRFAKVGFVCPAATLRLMEWSFGDKVVLFNRLPAEFSTWHWQCPLMSLPRAFQTRLDSIPTETPYLKVPQVAMDHWHARLEDAAPGRFRVGIAWAGRKTNSYDARRSMAFEQLLPLLHDSRVTWVSLQKWAVDDVPPMIPEDIDWLDWTEELSDFADTAALVSNLDLVLSVDSSMVHLGGALARPVWMMNRFDSEWRWLDRRDESPWYPGLRIFNQARFGDWASVLDAVQAALEALPMTGKLVGNESRPVPRKTNSSSRSIDQSMKRAIQYQGSGRLREAEAILDQLLQDHPKHAHAMHLRGVVAHQAGQLARAIEFIAKAIAVKPDVALFYSNLAEMCRQVGRLDEAIAHGQRAIDLDPTMVSAYSNLGIALYDARYLDRAEACHRKALAIDPNALSSLNNMGSIERARNNLSGAIAWYRRALAKQPDFIETLSNLGGVLVEGDRFVEAFPMLEKVLRQRPDHPEALRNLRQARLKQKQSEQD